jgi:acyl transferase domain-containing protein
MKDIAIIGMAGKFPEAENIEKFRENLISGRDSVREFSFERKSNTTVDLHKEYKQIAYLEDIDKFDHKFFNISKMEAEYMDPHQRIILEAVYETLENSGYPISHFHGSETAVFIGDTDQEYYKLADQFDPTLLTGNTSATTAGRISRTFNFRGLATMLDTACSSSLLAVHMACQEIIRGDAQMALACGVRIILFPDDKDVNLDLGIMATDGKTKSFSEKADGSGAGEAVASVLLKPLDEALRDKDIVYGVIKGSAVNQDAQLSGSLTAPSSQAQAEVIKKAWKKAQIDPESIGYIETHGSGTKLGDPIEVSGIDMAYKGIQAQKHSCIISSVKTNIAHCGSAAGIVGLIKAVLSLKHGEHYPSLHFDIPNPFIDFKNSVTLVNSTYIPWESNSNYPRRAGVSSFGLSGTNCHVILEEPPVSLYTAHDTADHLITLSAKTHKGLLNYLERFNRFLEECSESELQNIAYTSNISRTEYPYRTSFYGANKSELLERLKTVEIEDPQTSMKKLLFLFSGDSNITASQCEYFKTHHPVFREKFESCMALVSKTTDDVYRFAFQYSFYHLLCSKNVKTDNLLGIGSGDLVVAVLLDEMTLEDAIQELIQESYSDFGDLKTKLKALIERETEDEKVGFIEMGTSGCLSSQLKSLTFEDKDELYCTLNLSSESPCLSEIFAELYSHHYPIQWELFSGETSQKVKLPNYIFEKTRCWLKDPLKLSETSVEPTGEKSLVSLIENEVEFDETSIKHLIQDNWTATEQKVASIWVEVLKLDEISLEDDFFRLGGHSLMATRVIGRIEKQYGLKLEFQDIFTFATVKTLAAGVDQLIQEGKTTKDAWEITKAPEMQYYPLSLAQKRLWLIHEMHDGNTLAYNLPAALKVRGNLDIARVKKAFNLLVERHESLRTVFIEKDGQPVQKILTQVNFDVDQVQLNPEEDLDTFFNRFLKPFNLVEGPLLRVSVIQLSDQENILLFDMHHIISDGVSLGVLSQEFISLYEGKELHTLELQYKDYAYWQEQSFSNTRMQNQEGYWLSVFNNKPVPVKLPYDSNREVSGDFQGSSLQFIMDQSTLNGIDELCKSTGTTKYMLLLACYTVLLARYGNQEDIVVGSPIAGRSSQSLENIIGMFVNTLPMRNYPKFDLTFSQFLDDVKTNAIDAFENQDYPFELIIDTLKLNTNSVSPLFNTLFVLQNLEKPDIQVNDLEFSPMEISTGTSQFDITMEVNEDSNQLCVNLYYNTGLFEPETMELFKERFVRIVSEVIENPKQKISELNFNPFIEEEEQGLSFDLNFD